MRVPPDSGKTFIDKALSLLPEAPLLPLFEAIKQGDLNHDFSQYDIITGRGELKKLLAWVMNNQQKAFRIDIECNGNGGVVFRRWENVTLAGESSNIYGKPAAHYRVKFEARTCAPVKGNEEAFSHERVINYVSIAQFIFAFPT